MKNKILVIVILISCVFSIFSFSAFAQENEKSEITRSEKTSLGAVYYHNWFETYTEWWKYDNRYFANLELNSSQEARCLSPKQYHYRLPFFAYINTEVTSCDKIMGDVSSGVAEFPEYTKEIWTQEMEYACEAGINFMAYLWNRPNDIARQAYLYHIQTQGLDGKIKMCAILQRIKTEEMGYLVDAMCQDYWYTVDGRPVLYLYDAPDFATREVVELLREEVAKAQIAKTGQKGKDIYVVGMGFGSEKTAKIGEENGVDAASWYAFSGAAAVSSSMKKNWDDRGVKIRQLTFLQLTSYAMKCFERIYNADTNIDMMPTITLGYNTMPRIDNPVSWFWLEEDEIAYDGYTVEDPSEKQITKTVLEVLNWNKKNYKKTKSNTVLMYAWNEFDEGGWFCPTLAVDENGNVLKNEDGTNKINRKNLDAVKKGIELYRKHEQEAALYDVNDKLTEFIYYDKVTDTPKQTETPQNTQPNRKSSNGWLIWTILGGTAVIATVAVVVIVLKKKKVVQQNEKLNDK